MTWFRTFLFAVVIAIAPACSDDTDPERDQGAADAATADAAGEAGAPDQAAADFGPPTSKDISFTTSDGLKITGYITAGAPAGAPGVILIHQFHSTDKEWTGLDMELAKQGWIVLAFNMRGHGDSDPYGKPLQNLTGDPNGAPLDLQAAIKYLTGTGGADAKRLAVVGTSMGGSLAVAARIKQWCKTAVAFSPHSSSVAALSQTAGTGMSSVSYFAADQDQDAGTEAQKLYNATTAPRELKIYKGSADHGIAILAKQSDAKGLMISWLGKNL